MRALNAAERLPGFAPEHVEWHGFRFWATGLDGPMHTATIYAFPAGEDDSAFVRFGVAGSGFTASGQDGRVMTARDVANLLDVPVDSAMKVAASLGSALRDALRVFNAVHYPRTTRPAAPTPGRGPIDSRPRTNQPRSPGIDF
ncbi:MAG: hypothetical protein ACK5PP_03390 [Acidimicrobiales bacterium]